MKKIIIIIILGTIMLTLKHADLNMIGNDYMLGNNNIHAFIYTEHDLVSLGYKFNTSGMTIGIEKSKVFGNYHR